MLVMLPVASLEKRQTRFGSFSPTGLLEDPFYDSLLIPTWWWWFTED